jgi:transposase, IS5 family
MTRESHVRFCERLRGQSLPSTHLFGMKAHIGVGSKSGLLHRAESRAANVADVTQVDKLRHGGAESVVCAEAGRTGVEKRAEHDGRQVTWQVAARRGTYKKLDNRSALYKAKRNNEMGKAQLRAKLEHPFRVLKDPFGYVKTRFRGLVEEHSPVGHAVHPVEPVDGAPTFTEDVGECACNLGGGRRKTLATAQNLGING